VEEFPRTAAGRVFERELVSESVRCAVEDRGLAKGVQRRAAAQHSRVPAAEAVLLQRLGRLRAAPLYWVRRAQPQTRKPRVSYHRVREGWQQSFCDLCSDQASHFFETPEGGAASIEASGSGAEATYPPFWRRHSIFGLQKKKHNNCTKAEVGSQRS
jgi:hypothetical protein